MVWEKSCVSRAVGFKSYYHETVAYYFCLKCSLFRFLNLITLLQAMAPRPEIGSDTSVSPPDLGTCLLLLVPPWKTFFPFFFIHLFLFSISPMMHNISAPLNRPKPVQRCSGASSVLLCGSRGFGSWIKQPMGPSWAPGHGAQMVRWAAMSVSDAQQSPKMRHVCKRVLGMKQSFIPGSSMQNWTQRGKFSESWPRSERGFSCLDSSTCLFAP